MPEINLNTTEIQKMIASTKAVVFQKSPRFVKITLDGQEVQVRIGAGDGKLRVYFGSLIEEYSFQSNAINDAIAFVDSDYADKQFKKQVELLKETDNEEE